MVPVPVPVPGSVPDPWQFGTVRNLIRIIHGPTDPDPDSELVPAPHLALYLSVLTIFA
jgi:hypothetical protein